jgi:hypothetical protein
LRGFLSGLIRVSIAALVLATALVVAGTRVANASTYVVFIPLDDPIYDELDTLNSLGYIPDYLDEIRPISRIEAARLTIEAQHNLGDSFHTEALCSQIVRDLTGQLRDEVKWLRNNREDNPPTAILNPMDRAELQYVFSRGRERFWDVTQAQGPVIKADEGTPLLPDNDGLPTAPGSNETARAGAWGGIGGFLTGYGEAAIAGPFGHDSVDTSRLRPLGAEAVASLGNFALSFGEEEMWWGTGHFASISQSDNADPLPGFRLQNVHPFILPGFLRYLGQFRMQVFFTRLDAGRFVSRPSATSPFATFAHPWLSGQTIAFRTLPNFEWGVTHAIMFGGSGNNGYSAAGFIERATSINTGNPVSGNTNSQAGVYLRFRFPRLRDSVLYVETNAEDNLTDEARPIGGALPFLSVSYQGGYYLPRLTADGRTDLRFEWTIIEPNYSTHSDALYWSYNDRLMDDPLGPNASEIDFQVGRWMQKLTKGSGDLFFTDRAPKQAGNVFLPEQFYGPASTLHHERSAGFAFDLLTIPHNSLMGNDIFAFGKSHLALEYCEHMDFAPPGAWRGVASFTVGLKPNWEGWSWTR